MRARTSHILPIGFTLLLLSVPFISNAQTTPEVQAKIAALIEQLLSIQMQINQLLGQQPVMTWSLFPSVSPGLFAPTPRAPFVGGSVSEFLLQNIEQPSLTGFSFY